MQRKEEDNQTVFLHDDVVLQGKIRNMGYRRSGEVSITSTDVLPRSSVRNSGVRRITGADARQGQGLVSRKKQPPPSILCMTNTGLHTCFA